MPGAQSLRFQPATQSIPGSTLDTYLCPCCKKACDRFQLRKDRSYIPREVDLSGVPCAACLSKFDENCCDD